MKNITLIFILMQLWFFNFANAQVGEIGGRWNANCGLEYHPEFKADFVCGICDDFRNTNKELKQFRMYFVNDSLYFPDIKGAEKKYFSYKYDLKLKVLKFKYKGIGQTFKVIKAGETLILVSENQGVILLLKKE